MDDGGPAFPVECVWNRETPTQGIQTGNATGWAMGVTVRDYFADSAMRALLSLPGEDCATKQHMNRTLGRDANAEFKWPEDYRIYVAAESYAQADAMLAARELQPPHKERAVQQ